MSAKDKAAEGRSRREQVIRLRELTGPALDAAGRLEATLREAGEDIRAEGEENRRLMAEIDRLAEDLGMAAAVPPLGEDGTETGPTDAMVDRALRAVSDTARAFPALSAQEYAVSVFSGFTAALIDLLLVGTPEVVKLSRGEERFDGSVLTAALRTIGTSADGRLAPALQWLSNACKVPYDRSAQKGVLTPNNHRLRSFAHDPFLGLFFAVADIWCGTTTCIDNDGRLRVIASAPKASGAEQLLAVFYYLGHILSDLCTARGVPVPGFCLTQFFTAGAEDRSLAGIAEEMYRDGYDLRHLASAAVPVAVQGLLIDAYLALTRGEEERFCPAAERERRDIARRLKREKMIFVCRAAASGGNLAKFLMPPSCGNPCALNMAQWLALAQSSCAMACAGLRERTAEAVMDNREAINQNWSVLQNAESGAAPASEEAGNR